MRPFIRFSPSFEVIEQRYRQVGGIPRHIFAEEHAFTDELTRQDEAIKERTKDHAIKLAKNELSAVSSETDMQPKSVLIGYDRVEGDDVFETKEVVVVSALVAEKLYTKFMADLWQVMIDLREDIGWKIFEAYTRELLIRRRHMFEGRWCTGTQYRPTVETFQDVPIGGCSTIRLVSDIVGSAEKTPDVVFYSLIRNYPLIDFMYRDENKIFHAFQVTIAEKHDCKIEHLKKLVKRVGGVANLKLYYLVPDYRFKTFVTRPSDPMSQVPCAIYHIRIDCPKQVYGQI